MKKNLIVALALVFVLGIAGTAFAAANPFVDVPAKHWAYDAVTKLAQAGILDGYGDGTYRGERLATRYEMAQATAKAMARADKADAQMKGLIDKLAVEFAAELNNLGVRVAKLEKNASTIKFWGDARMRYQSGNAGALDSSNTGSNRFQQRIRIYAKADLNDKAAFYGRMDSEWTGQANGNKASNVDIFWDYGYFEWTFNPSFKFDIGRLPLNAAYSMFNTNGGYNGMQFLYNNGKFAGKLAYGDAGDYSKNKKQQEVMFLDLNYKFTNKFSMNAALFNSSNDRNQDNGTNKEYAYKVWTLGFQAQLNDDFNLTSAYFSNTAKRAKFYSGNDLGENGKTPDGWYANLWYKGADKAKVGSWGLNLNYRNVKAHAIDANKLSGVFANSMVDTTLWSTYGVKGWGFQANYTISKNAILTATYETLNRNNSNLVDGTAKLKPFYYLQMNVYF